MNASPLFSSDRPASEDAFNRMPFAKALAAALMQVSGRDGLVIGLEGGWGTGKSSLIEFLKAELKERATSDAAPVVVEFNPWMVSGTGALVDALVTQIAASINAGPRKVETALKAGQKLLGYASHLKHLKHLKHLQILKAVPGASWAGHLAEELSKAGAAAEDNVEAAQKTLDELKKALPALDLAARRRELEQALKEFGRPILVIVDDLDRLPAEEIRAMVQTIKAVADFPVTTYLLAYDRDVVVDALGNGKPQVGAAYIEKIVQVAYPIPPIPRRQLHRFVDRHIRAQLRVMGIALRSYEEERMPAALELVSRLVRHPRDAARLLNRLALSIPATHDDVNAADVIVMEALSQRCPAAREHIYRDPQTFVGRGFRDNHVALSEPASEVEHPEKSSGSRTWEPYLPTDPLDGPLVGEAFGFLFAQNNPFRQTGNVLSIGESDRLARYFRMTSLESVPDMADMRAVLAHPSELAVMFANDPEEAGLYLQWMPGHLPLLDDIDAAGSIEAVARELSARVAAGRFDAKQETLFANVLVALLDKLHRREALLVLEALQPRLPLETARLIVRPDKAATALDEADEGWDETMILEKGIWDDWAARVRAAIESGTVLDERGSHRILWDYGTVADRREWVFEEVRKLYASEDGLRRFIAPLRDQRTTVEDLRLVRYPAELALALRQSPLHGQYRWLASLLEDPASDAVISANAEQAIDPRRTAC